MRKIINIAAIPETPDNYGQLYALCNDGSVWAQQIGTDEWVLISDIPQSEIGEQEEVPLTHSINIGHAVDDDNS